MGLPDGDSKEGPLRLVAQLLEREGVPYALIGGVAVQLHTEEPRSTLDIDLAVPTYADVPRQALLAAGVAPLFLGFVLLFQLRNHRRIGERRGVTWCKNCLTMDKTTFAIADVKTALNGYVKIKIQAEDMDAEPVKSLLSRFNAVACQPTWCLARLTRRPSGRRAGARSQNSANCTSTRPALGQNP